MSSRTRVTLAAIFAAVTVSAFAAATDDPLEEVRKLYGAAFYDRALAAIEQVAAQPSLTPADQQSVRRYKALCLIALDRVDAAASVTIEMVRADPLASSDPADPPRLRDLIEQTRVRVLPEIVRERYARGRAWFERKAVAEASAEFEAVVAMLDDSRLGLSAPEFADLRMVATGFLELMSMAAEAPLPLVTPPNRTPEIPSNNGLEVLPPVAIDQRVPRWPEHLRIWLKQPREGLVEVLVGVNGAVESATIVTPTHPAYDHLLLAAARTWRYRPAMLNGVPIAQKKLVRVVITASSG